MQPLMLTRTRKDELPPIIENSEALKNLAAEAELSQRAKIKASSIAMYVQNKMLPGITDYNKIARVLGWERLTGADAKVPPLNAGSKNEFTVGKSYRIDSAKGCVFRYEGKRGIHHVFCEIRGNWTRTYTDAQLIGATTEEVKEE